MKGKIRAYSDSVNAGLINGDNGKIYQFTESEWHGKTKPANNEIVDFQGAETKATDVTNKA